MARAASAQRFRNRNFPYSIVTDGTANGKVDFGSHASYRLNTAGAISIWALKNTSSGTTGFIEIYTSGNERITIYGSGANIVFGMVTGGSVILNTAITTNKLTDGWHHFVLTWDVNSAQVFLDGNTTAIFTSAGDKRMNFGSTPQFQIGTSLSGAGNVIAKYTKPSLYNAKLAGSDAADIYLKNQLPASVVTAWGFTEGSGTSVAVSQGSGNAGTMGSGASWSTHSPCASRSVSAARFNVRNFAAAVECPAGGWIDFGTHANYQVNTGSISFWLRIQGPTATNQRLCALGSGAFGTNEIIIYINTDSNLGFNVLNDVNSAPTVNINSSFKFQRGDWYNVVIGWDVNSFEAYINGVSVATSSGDKRMNMSSSAVFMLNNDIGGGRAPAACYTQAALYNTKLTAAEALALYLRGTRPASEVVAWDMTEGSGNPAVTRGTGNAGTLTASPTWSTTRTPGKLRNAVT